MRIRTQFILTMLLFGLVLGGMTALVIATNQAIDRTTEQEEIAGSLEREAFELGYLSNDFLIYRDSQTLARWDSKYASFVGHLASLKPEKPEQQAAASSLRANSERLHAVFAEVRRAAQASATPGGPDPAFLQISWSRMEIQNQGMVYDASILARMLRDQNDALKQRSVPLSIGLLVVLAAFFATNYVLIFRRTLGTIADLKEGTAVVGSGNLDFAIPVQRHDEIGELAHAFNRMAVSLKDVTASKTELEREIAERKRVEAERERLLERVQEQAEELQSQNEELHAQSEELQSQNEELQVQQAEVQRLLADEQEARNLAERAVKVRDEFISVAAHELKTPVTSLQGFSQALMRQYEKTGAIDPERLLRSTQRISEQSKRLTRLTEQLLNLSRLETGKLVLTMDEISLGALVKSVVSAIQHAHPERTIRVEADEEVYTPVDALRLEQVVTNLIENALKFSPAESPVEVEAGRDGEGWVWIAVRDHGIGIPEEKRGQVFERFFQAHPEQHYDGMGIGLYISHQIVEMHGGTIRLEQPEGKGSRFVVALPASSPDHVSLEAAPAGH